METQEINSLDKRAGKKKFHRLYFSGPVLGLRSSLDAPKVFPVWLYRLKRLGTVTREQPKRPFNACYPCSGCQHDDCHITLILT